MTNYNTLLNNGVELPDGRVVSEGTYLVGIKELLIPDPNAREFPDSSLGRILTRLYRPGHAPDMGAPRP